MNSTNLLEAPKETMPNCPKCKSNEEVKLIKYGLIRDWPEENNKYYIRGGCMMGLEKHYCAICQEKFKKPRKKLWER